MLLRAGALPAKLTIVEERTVGPGLGEDSIEAGKLALVGRDGARRRFHGGVLRASSASIAVVAVVINVGMIFGILSVLGATLTLPGIAGILLTIGMAVDSNVIIYERIREESRLGRSAISSLNEGFGRALGTIIDANFTTLLAAGILFFLGTGPGARLRRDALDRHPDDGLHGLHGDAPAASRLGTATQPKTLSFA